MPPNIEGTIDAESDTFNALSGSFYRMDPLAGYPVEAHGQGSLAGFKASLSSEIYNGDHLQTSALQTLVCIKS